jgi:predicted flap endonuclease-1-like 5' DNA nuclease
MSKAAVFALAFLVFFVLTLVITVLPPGDIITSSVGVPEAIADITIVGSINGTVILNGVINGLVWGIIVFAVYAVIYRTPKKKLPPMITPTYPTAPPPKPTPVTSPVTSPVAMSRKPQERKRQRKVTKRRTYVALNQDIETIEGIGPTYGSKLRNSGVNVVGDLLREGATRFGRRILARKVDVAPGTMLRWVHRADFFRIRGVGAQYSELLESAGVRTVADLSKRDAYSLQVKLRQLNRKKHLVRRTPPLTTIRRWIESAKNLKRMVLD